MQTKFLSALCSLALVFSLASCKDDKPSTGPDKPEPNENALAAPVPTIKYQDFNSVEIVWDAVANADSYEYFLVGGGRQETKERIAVYEDLEAGDYTIRVKAIPAEGSEYTESVWGDIAVSIVVSEPETITLESLVGNWVAESKETLYLDLVGEGDDAEPNYDNYIRKSCTRDLTIEIVDLHDYVPVFKSMNVLGITGWDPIQPEGVLLGLPAEDNKSIIIVAGSPTADTTTAGANGEYLEVHTWITWSFIKQQEKMVWISPSPKQYGFIYDAYTLTLRDGQYLLEPCLQELSGDAIGKVRSLLIEPLAFDPATRELLGFFYWNNEAYPLERMAGKISLTKGGAGASALPAVKKADYAFGALSYNKNYVMAR